MEFEPLLEPGIHDFTKETLEQHFVYAFALQGRRKYLFERFGFLLEKVEEVGMAFEVWVNGSFVTKKEEPDDIDIAFFFDPNQLPTLPPEKFALFNEVRNIELSKYRYNCDVRFVPNNDMNNRSYWRGWFGYTRSEKVKGFARISI